jgi:hypothetical protein
VGLGRALAQAVSCRLHTAAAWVRTQVKSCEMCDGQSGTGAGFLQVLRFPLTNFIPPTSLTSLKETKKKTVGLNRDRSKTKRKDLRILNISTWPADL